MLTSPRATADGSAGLRRAGLIVTKRCHAQSVLRGLLLAAWMTLIPSVGLAQDCLQWADRTPPRRSFLQPTCPQGTQSRYL